MIVLKVNSFKFVIYVKLKICNTFYPVDFEKFYSLTVSFFCVWLWRVNAINSIKYLLLNCMLAAYLWQCWCPQCKLDFPLLGVGFNTHSCFFPALTGCGPYCAPARRFRVGITTYIRISTRPSPMQQILRRVDVLSYICTDRWNLRIHRSVALNLAKF